jgi:hypothetical protein
MITSVRVVLGAIRGEREREKKKILAMRSFFASTGFLYFPFW